MEDTEEDSKKEYNSSTDEQFVSRRGYLQLAGVAVGSAGVVSLQSDTVQAASSGYGEGGYGEGAYGGGGLSVATQDSTSESDFSNTLTVETESGGPLVEYEFTIDGTVTKGPAAEGNDTITENGDGTTTVTGMTGNGYTDDFQYNGELTDWSASVDSTHYTLLVNGDEVDTTAQSVNKRLLSIETQEGGPLIEYEFTIDGTVTKGPAAEGNDTITENGDGTTTVTGMTGNGYTDDFQYNGDVTDWSASVDSSHYTILVNGTSVSPDSL